MNTEGKVSRKEFATLLLAGATSGLGAVTIDNSRKIFEITDRGTKRIQELFPGIKIDTNFSTHSENPSPTNALILGETDLSIFYLLSSQDLSIYPYSSTFEFSGYENISKDKIIALKEKIKETGVFFTTDGNYANLSLTENDLDKLNKKAILDRLTYLSNSIIPSTITSIITTTSTNNLHSRRQFLRIATLLSASAFTGLIFNRRMPVYGLLTSLTNLSPQDIRNFGDVDTFFQIFNHFRDLNMAINTQLLSQWDLSKLTKRIFYFQGNGHISSADALTVPPAHMNIILRDFLLGRSEEKGFLDVISDQYLNSLDNLQKQRIHLFSILLFQAVFQCGIGYIDSPGKFNQIQEFKATYKQKKIDGQTAYLTVALALQEHIERKKMEYTSDPEKLQKYSEFIDSLIAMNYGKYADTTLTIAGNGVIHTRLLDQRPDDETFLLSYLEISHRDGFVTNIRDTRTR